MDYLDTKKAFRHHIMLYVGYLLIAFGITIGTLILVQLAYGFGLGKNGAVIQNGLIFFSSQPNPANIYVNGKLRSEQTNTRLALPANIYDVTLARDGYRDWKRSINLEGGSVEHFDYPFLFPKELTPKSVKTYASQPALMTQSPDKRWLLVAQPASLTNFDVYNLRNPTDPATTITLPATLLTKSTTGNDSLKLVEWSADNRHLVVRHIYDQTSEFILVDREQPGESVNLNVTLGVSPLALSLIDRKYDRYYLHEADGNLRTATLKQTAPLQRLPAVLAYKSYGNDTILYVTGQGAPEGKVLVKLLTGSKTYTVRSLNSGSGYLADLTKYDGTMYVAVGSVDDSRVYIYKDPIGQRQKQPKQAPVPSQVLHVEQPNRLSFSSNAQFIAAENGSKFGVYDIENELGYNYNLAAPLDTPQTYATWMDGNRLVYVSAGQLRVADYDNQNNQSLVAADPLFTPAFTPDFQIMYNLVKASDGTQFELMQTPLLTTVDQ